MQRKKKKFTELAKQVKTLASDSSSTSKVIIIEPVADDRPVEKFFANDIVLSKALARSLFDRAGIAKFSKNLGCKILVLTSKDEPELEMSVLLRTTQQNKFIKIWDARF
jgi:hypothetical protein